MSPEPLSAQLMRACVLPVVAAASFVPALLVGAAGPRMSVMTLYAGLLIGALLVLPRLARPDRRGSARTVSALGALAVLPALLVGSAYSWSEPLIARGWTCGTGAIGLPFVMVAALAALATGGGGAGVLLARFGGRVAAWGTTVLAVTCVLGAAGLVARAAPRAAGIDPDDWLRALPEEGAVEAPATDRYARFADGVQVRFDCAEGASHECRARLCAADCAACGEWSDRAVAPGRLRLLRDAEAGLYVLGESPSGALAFSSSLHPAQVTPRDLGDRASVPTPAWLLVLFGALAVVYGAIERARVAWSLARLRGRPGWVTDGTITFDDGRWPPSAPVDAGTVDGPALAWPRGDAGPPSYRQHGHPGPWRSSPGTRSDHRARLWARAISWDVFVMTAAALSVHALWVV